MRLWEKILKDINNNKNIKGRIIVVSFTVMSYFREKSSNKVLIIIYSPIFILYKLITDLILGCEIPCSTKIGHGFIIHHGRATVLNAHVVLGDNVTIKHNTTIGNKENHHGEDLGSPTIGSNVIIGPHSIILGPITVGDNSVIGAGSVVVKNVEANTVVAGNPAKMIKKL
jgi:putative colanic acid biosynthesis acetyltransferase WcaB